MHTDEIIDELNRVRITAIFLQSSLSSPNIGEVVVAQAEIDNLIDNFQSAFSELVTGEDIEKARTDIEFFLKLIDSTARQCRTNSREKGV